MSKICCITASGPSRVYVVDGSYIIAADGGIDKLKALGISPDLIVGDFDSSSYRPSGHNVISFPTKKDDTDTVIAIKEAIKRGFDTVVISGGMGGCLDHTVANLQALSYARENGVRAFLTDGSQSAAIVDSAAVIKGKRGGRCSVFAFGGKAVDVKLKGLEYECDGIDLVPDFPLGVSNAFTDKKAEISVKNGALLVIWQGVPEEFE